MSKSQRQKQIEELEHKFWQSMVDGETRVATSMLTEPALMVSSHGANKFDHAAYEKMAADDTHKLVGFKLDQMDVVFPTDDVAVATYHVAQSMERKGEPLEMEAYDTSTWVNMGGAWKCVAHTESAVAPRG